MFWRVFLAALSASLTLGLAAAPKFTGLWENIDDRHYVSGQKLDEHSLDSMVVLVAAFRAEDIKDKKVPFVSFSDALGYSDTKRFRILCSARGQRLNAGKLEKICEKAKLEPPTVPIYYQAGTTNEPEIATFPFYYAVSPSGDILQKGGEFSTVLDAANAAVDKLPRDDLYFGLMRPSEKCAGVTNLVVEGKSVRPAYQYLKKIMLGRDPEAAREAYMLIGAMDQKRDMRIVELRRMIHSSPGKAMFELERILKMWPELRGDKDVQAMIEAVNSAEDAPKIVKIVADCEKIAAMPIKKKNDTKRPLMQLAMLRKRLEKLQKSKNLSVQAEAISYMSRLDQVIEQLNNWEPPPPPEKK